MLLDLLKKSPYLISAIPIELSGAGASGKAPFGGWFSQVLRIREYSPQTMAFTCSLSRLLLWQHQTHPGDGLLGDMSCLADSLPRVNLFL